MVNTTTKCSTHKISVESVDDGFGIATVMFECMIVNYPRGLAIVRDRTDERRRCGVDTVDCPDVLRILPDGSVARELMGASGVQDSFLPPLALVEEIRFDLTIHLDIRRKIGDVEEAVSTVHEFIEDP